MVLRTDGAEELLNFPTTDRVAVKAIMCNDDSSSLRVLGVDRRNGVDDVDLDCGGCGPRVCNEMGDRCYEVLPSNFTAKSKCRTVVVINNSLGTNSG